MPTIPRQEVSHEDVSLCKRHVSLDYVLRQWASRKARPSSPTGATGAPLSEAPFRSPTYPVGPFHQWVLWDQGVPEHLGPRSHLGHL